jgi:hypothetical protein
LSIASTKGSITGEEFAPADTPTRAANEAIQIGRAGAALIGPSLKGPMVCRLFAGAKEIRTAGPILVFIDRGGRFETNTDGTALVDKGAIAGDPPHDPRAQYRCHPSNLETQSALVLN